MARNSYYVVTQNGEWKISHNQKHFGPYQSQRAAIRAAVDAAHSSGQQGIDSQVLIQGQNNQWRAEWTYGNDPYPPPG